MVSEMQLSLIQSYLTKSTDATEKTLLNDLLDEMSYRVPKQVTIGSCCPSCGTIVEFRFSHCAKCGQMLE